MSKRVLIAIPAYRCEKQIRRVMSGLARLRPRIPLVEKVIVLDNQSPDGTYLAAVDQARQDNVSDWIEVYVNPTNCGLGGSQKKAFRMAAEFGFSHVIILHGDDQANTEDIPRLIAGLDEGKDAVLGARFMKGSRRDGYSLLRTAGNIGLNGVYSLLSLSRVSDLGSGLNGFRTKALVELPIESFSDHFTFNMDLLLSLIEHRKKIIFIPIHWRENDQVSNAKTFAVGWTALKSVVAWRLRGTLNG